ncbi:MAG: EVE domain-containing protein [Desulfuromonadaceae bacterium]|nr:EVE domain-containing protein [Desulfuromonadaceae bacterium]
MHYWLMKSEPSCFGLTDLQQRPDQTEPWDGVRNYQARNMLRDQMQCGDRAFLYHSNCKETGIVAVMEIVHNGYPDPTAFDPREKHFDPENDPNSPRWFMVDVKLIRPLKRTILLSELRQHAELDGLQLLSKGNRLSVMPVSEKHWQFILSLEGSEG